MQGKVIKSPINLSLVMWNFFKSFCNILQASLSQVLTKYSILKEQKWCKTETNNNLFSVAETKNKTKAQLCFQVLYHKSMINQRLLCSSLGF